MKKARTFIAILMIYTCFLFVFSACNIEKNDSRFGFAIDQDFRIVQDADGENVIIVTYLFENKSSDDARSFSDVVTHTASQNHIELNEVFVLPDSAGFSCEAQMLCINKGDSIQVEVAYKLLDDSTKVYVEGIQAIDGLISANYIGIGKFLDIAE